ncbi:MAG: hypothetical protein AAFO03_22385 [Bacteroidota bacterium]
MRFLTSFLFLSLYTAFLSAQTAPTIGIPTFESVVPIEEGSLLLLGEAAERGLSQQQGLRLVDRRRMDAVFFAREEVRHEDYLASDREQIAALGADYILLGRILQRDPDARQWVSEDGLPRKSVSIFYRIKVSLYNVSTGNLMRSEAIELSAFVQTQMGEPEMNLPPDAFLGQVERQAAEKLSGIVRSFAARSFQRGMQMVDAIKEKGKRITEVLVVSTMETKRGQNLRLYTNEYYLVNGDSLARPIFIAEARIRKSDGQFLECDILDGARDTYDAFHSGQEIFAIAGEQKLHWLFRFMSMGMLE